MSKTPLDKGWLPRSIPPPPNTRSILLTRTRVYGYMVTRHCFILQSSWFRLETGFPDMFFTLSLAETRINVCQYWIA
jgi:hypothetical protein